MAGDIAGAERTLVAVADQSGDHALVSVLDEMPPKDLLAVMREFDSSRESVVNMLVTPEQFARAIVLEKKYGDRTGERLRAMVNAVIHRDGEDAGRGHEGQGHLGIDEDRRSRGAEREGGDDEGGSFHGDDVWLP